MKIISLEVDAFKRVRAVAITPTGNLVEVSGENGNGKSSVLDAIWAALGGKDAAPTKPIHTGEDKAEIRLLLGEGGEPKLKVTRRFRLKDGAPYTTDLFVENAEGARFSSPQGILDALVGDYCFDPLAFTRLKDEEQIKTLRQFVEGVDFDQLEGLNRRDYDDRTEVNRTAKQLRAQAAALPTFEGDEPEAVDEEAIVAKLSGAADTAQIVARREAAVQRIASLEAQIAQAQKTIEEGRTFLADNPAPEPIDVEAVQQEHRNAMAHNAQVAKFRQRQELEAKAKEAEDQALVLSGAIQQRTDDAAKAVQASKMPVAGLGFGDGVVTLNDEPFAQASTAEKIRASLAIAAALSPKLRVARIADGSLLDKKSWAALSQYAEEHDLQVWVETVDAKSPAAVIIEDGGNAPTPPDEPHAPVEQIGDVL